MNDPLAEALCIAACAADNALNTSGEYNCTLNLDYGKHTASWLRERRLEVVRDLYPDVDELLTDLGGDEHEDVIGLVELGGSTRPVELIWRWDSSRSVWVFPKEDA